MEDSVEFKAVRRCRVALETALKGLDRNMVNFLDQNGFITDGVCDQVLNPVTFLSAADKAHELVKGIKNRVKQDKGSYFVLVGGLIQGGVLYQPIVTTLTEEYQRQLVEQATFRRTVPRISVAQEEQTRKCVCVCVYEYMC